MTFRVALTFDAEHPDRPTEPGVAESILATLDARRGRGPRSSSRAAGPRRIPTTARRIADGRPPRRQPLPLPRPDAALHATTASRPTCATPRRRSATSTGRRSAAVVPLPVRGGPRRPRGRRGAGRPGLSDDRLGRRPERLGAVRGRGRGERGRVTRLRSVMGRSSCSTRGRRRPAPPCRRSSGAWPTPAPTFVGIDELERLPLAAAG